MTDVRLRVGRVRAPDSVLDAYGESGSLSQERTLLDIQADGRRILSPNLTFDDHERARRMRLWAERGDFRLIHADDLDDIDRKAPQVDAVEALRAVYEDHAQPSTSEQAEAQASAPSTRLGTIGEKEFVPLRDTLLHQLEVSLFHAEQAQNLLGMLIQNTRSDTSSVLAAQSEYFLDPHALSLSALERAIPEDHNNAPPRPLSVSEQKLILQEKHASIRSAAQILVHGADEMEQCLESERSRWHGLQKIQRRGWKLTPGRPLVDIERFDTPTVKRDVLQGFGIPIVQGNGSIKEEGARDAWIGYGPSEAPISILQRTLAYWADAPTPGPHLAFPDRTWRRLQVEFHDHASKQIWKSGSTRETRSDDADLDAQLYDAQLDVVDAELFRELAVQSGTLSPVLARTISDHCISLPLSSTLEMRFVLVPYDESSPGEESPWSTLLLHVLRLRMLRGWTVRIRAMWDKRAASIALHPPKVRFALMAPLWELYEYTLFLSRLRATLDHALSGFGNARILWEPYGAIHDVHQWISHLLDLSTSNNDLIPVGGSIWIYYDSVMISHLSLRAPSHMFAHFPHHATSNGTGVRMSVELESLAPFLVSECAALASA
jgi:hypothetical protein